MANAALKTVAGALLLLTGIGGMLYSVFVWILPGVDVGFLDHGFLAVGTLVIFFGLWVGSTGLHELRNPKGGPKRVRD